MEKWWNGRVAEGEIDSQFAWYITPSYDVKNRMGNFTVTLFQAPQPSLRDKYSLRRLLYKILSLRLFTRLRLKVLSKFPQWEKEWRSSDITYQVRGYLASEVKTALEEVGFTQVQIRTIEGPDLDNNHSAYFICRKLSSSPR